MRIIIHLFYHLVAHAFPVFARLGLLVVLLSGLGLFVPGAAPAVSAHPGMTLEQLVNPDGTLNLSTGFNGSLDLAGWQVALDATRGPVFTPLNGESRSAVGRAGLPGRSAASDGQLATSETYVWQPFPHGGLENNIEMYSNVYALAVVGQDFYVGGAFSKTADGLITGLNGIAKFDSLTSTWSALPNEGLAGSVEALAVIGTDLYVGGWFTQTADGSLTGLGRIARFSISENKWYALPNVWTYSEEVKAFAVVGNDLYVGGSFYFSVGTVVYFGIAKFSGGTWSALPKNWVDGRVDAFAISGNDLYVCGQLWVTPGTVNHIFRFDLSSSTWFPLPNNGLNGTTSVFALIGSDLYVGGQFSGTMDGQVTNLNHIARFDLNSSTWFPLPNNGLNGNVFALAAGGTDLYVGGDFTNTADSSVSGLNHIAMFNTADNTWSALSNGGLNSNVHNGNVRALTVAGGYLVVGGQFDQTTDGAVTELNHIAAYSGVSLRFNVFLPLILR
jgi:hypothetical protein